MFKNVMGLGGFMVWDHMYHFGAMTELVAAGVMFNWAYQSARLLGSSVRHVELHRDGKTVTFSPIFGKSFDVKIS